MSHVQAENWDYMMDADDYDPRKPEFITQIGQDEAERQSVELLEQQIEKLEALLARRQPNSEPTVFNHYEQVLAELRYKSGQGRHRTHARIRSTPAGQATEDESVTRSRVRNFTHARVRSAPTTPSWADMPPDEENARADRILSWADMPPDDEDARANLVHGDVSQRGPGAQLYGSQGMPWASRGLNTRSMTNLTGTPPRTVAWKLAPVSLENYALSPQAHQQRRRPAAPQMGASKIKPSYKGIMASKGLMAMCIGRHPLDESEVNISARHVVDI